MTTKDTKTSLPEQAEKLCDLIYKKRERAKYLESGKKGAWGRRTAADDKRQSEIANLVCQRKGILARIQKMIDQDVIHAITTELNMDEYMFMSWGALNEMPTLTNEHNTAYQFDVDGALLFTGTVKIVHENNMYYFQLISNNKVQYHSPKYSLKQCISEIDMKIERGPTMKSYKKHVEEWIKN